MSCSAQDGGSGIAQIAANHVPAMGGRTKRGTHVRSARVRDMGAPGKWADKHGPGIGPLKEGKLVHLGYSATRKITSRHRALKKAVKRYGALSTFRKLNAASTYTKRTSKGRSRTFKADRNWVKKSFM